MLTRTFSILFVAVFALAITLPATAEPVSVVYDDATTCDPLEDGKDVHELGNGSDVNGVPLFPLDEVIGALAFTTNLIACPGSDDALIPNTLVRMENLSGIDWRKVWYVADPGLLDTTISNVDGTVNAGQAFLINSIGANRPLISESIAANNIFQAGEIWEFIIDDYVSGFGGAASDFLSVGLVGSLSSLDSFNSTGSIIAVAVPEPATCMLLLIGLGAMAKGARRQRG